MPSRKKAKGKARKAAKEAKAAAAAARAEDEESQAVVEVAANQRQVREKMLLQRLVINNVSPQNCRHRLVHLSAGEEKICLEFINAYLAVFVPFIAQDKVGPAFFTAYNATSEKYADVYASKLETVISVFLSYGTQCILDGDNLSPQLYASIACYFEELRACLRDNLSTARWAKIVELYTADDHTLVSYYRKRIPCSCLDEKYKEVKSVKKMGRCSNPSCNHPGRKVERSKMFCCTRCGASNYCSIECQRANWKEHRVQCDQLLYVKAAFDWE